MINAYINYPNPHVTVHQDSGCGQIRSHLKSIQRRIKINVATISDELIKFQNNNYHFGSNPETNDIWLEIDFQDSTFEMAVLEHIIRQLGSHYSPLANIKPSIHC